MTPSIAVTGSTGAVGGAVAALLADSGTSLRLLVRDAGRAPAIPNSAVAQCSYGAIASGELSRVSDYVERGTGRRAITLSERCRRCAPAVAETRLASLLNNELARDICFLSELQTGGVDAGRRSFARIGGLVDAARSA